MLKNGFYNLIGGIIRLGLGLVSVPLLVQLLGTEQYGLYAILFALINVAALSEWSISMVLTVFLSECLTIKNEERKSIEIASNLKLALLLVAILSIITGFLILILSPYIVNNYGNLDEAQKQILLLGCYLTIIIVLLRLLHQYFLGIEQAFNKYRMLNLINTSYHIFQTLGVLLIAWFNKSIISIVLVQIFVSLIFIFIHLFLCIKYDLLKYITRNVPLLWPKFKKIIKYGSRTYLGILGSAFFSQGDRLVVGHILGLESAGIYAALKSVVTQINSLSSIPVQPIVPVISSWYSSSGNELAGSDQDQKIILIKKSILLNAVMAVGIGFVVILFSSELSRFMFGEAVLAKIDVDDYLIGMTIIYTIYSLNAVGYYILFAVKKELLNTIVTLICGSLSLLLIYFFCLYFGIAGAVIGNSAYILTLLLLYLGFKFVKFPISLFFHVTLNPFIVLILSIISALTLDNIMLKVNVFFILSLIGLKPIYNYIVVNVKFKSRLH